MTYKTFYNKVIALLPSADLRAMAKSGEHVFSDADLLKFIDSLAPSFDKKAELFDRAAEVFTDEETKYHAKMLARHCRKVYDDFASPSDDAVYVIQSHSNFYNDWRDIETLTVKTFDDALATVKALSRRDSKYLCEGERYEYRIIKQPTVRASTERGLSKKSDIGLCKWDVKHGIVNIYAWRLKNEFGVYCDTCKRKQMCLESHAVSYPTFLNPYDLVAYKNPDNYSGIEYGVLMCDMTRNDNNYTSYVIELDSEYIKERRADERTEDGDCMVYFDHSHPPYCELYKPNRADVPDNVYADYLYAADVLKKIDCLATSSDYCLCDEDADMLKTHFMHLSKQPFDLIKSGVKTVEVRLNDEKRRTIKSGDSIVFTLGDCRETVKAAVIGLQRFKTFLGLMQSDLFDKTGLQGCTPEQAAQAMYKYYTLEQESKYGVLAIEFELVDDK